MSSIYVILTTILTFGITLLLLHMASVLNNETIIMLAVALITKMRPNIGKK